MERKQYGYMEGSMNKEILKVWRSCLAGIILLILTICTTAVVQAQTYTVLHSFQCFPNDGQAPLGSLAGDSAGNIYGTTRFGGTFAWGTVYKLSPDGTVTVLYSFTDGTDGAEPMGGVILDSDGNLYGTAARDGFTKGVVFRLTPDGSLTVLHSFTGNPDGEFPQAGLLRDANSNLYGTTMQGGSFNAGTVFRVSRAASSMKC
jgi:uncharacterized repeat protein (TIGR03803 family)